MAEFDIDTKTIDTVTYNNLVPGLEYTFHGKLLSKKTGKILDTQDVVKTIDKHNGSVEVEFEYMVGLIPRGLPRKKLYLSVA